MPTFQSQSGTPCQSAILVAAALLVWLYVNVGGVGLFRNSFGFWKSPVFPSSFGNAGFVYEGGTRVFEVHVGWFTSGVRF